jgi:hypothetical protein
LYLNEQTESNGSPNVRTELIIRMPQPSVSPDHAFEQPSSFQALDAGTIAMLNTLLLSVCAETEWEYGESWVPDANGILELSSAWCINPALSMDRAVPWMQFQVCSKAFVMRPGEGLPGRVWQSQTAEWLEDVSAQSETYFLRNQIAKGLEVRTGFGIPLGTKAQPIAVVVFFLSKLRSVDTHLMQQTQTIISKLHSEIPGAF